MGKLHLYKCENGSVGVSTEKPDFQTSILVVRDFTAEEVFDILENGNFTYVNYVLDRVEKSCK